MSNKEKMLNGVKWRWLNLTQLGNQKIFLCIFHFLVYSQLYDNTKILGKITHVMDIFLHELFMLCTSVAMTYNHIKLNCNILFYV